MLSIEEVRALLTKPTGKNKVLSIYLSTDASAGTWKSNMYSLQKRFDSAENALDGADKSQFAEERKRVEKFLKGFKPQGKCLAIFSCTPAKFWRTMNLNAAAADAISFSAAPRVTPLLELLDEHQRFCAVAIDNESARILLVKISELETVKQIKHFVPGKHKQTEFNSRVEQKHRSQVEDHLRKVIGELESLQKKSSFNRLFIGGTPEARSTFEKMLPSHMRSVLCGRFSTSLNQTDDAIKKSAMNAAAKYEEAKEKETIESLETRASKKKGAVIGCDDTLLALHNASVFKLIAAGDGRVSGCKCGQCGFASQTVVKKCPLCNSDTKRADDLVEEAVQTAIRNGVDRIEVLKGSEMGKFATKYGMGAFLKI